MLYSFMNALPFYSMIKYLCGFLFLIILICWSSINACRPPRRQKCAVKWRKHRKPNDSRQRSARWSCYACRYINEDDSITIAILIVNCLDIQTISSLLSWTNYDFFEPWLFPVFVCHHYSLIYNIVLHCKETERLKQEQVEEARRKLGILHHFQGFIW